MVWSKDATPCGVPVYEAEYTDLKGAGFPHPVTGESMDPATIEVHLVPEEDPGNKYGVPYFVGKLNDGTFVRILND